MKKMILALFSGLVFSSYAQASTLSEYLNDPALDAISCSDLKYDHDKQNYNLSISVDIEDKNVVEVVLKNNYGQETLVVNPVEASADLKTIQFSNYTLELTDKPYLGSYNFWGVLKQADVVVAEVVCGFVFWSTGE